MPRQLRAILILAAAVGGCTTAAPASPFSQPAAPTPTRSEAPATEAELESQRFRDDFGLRSDLSWIREVAADPGADRTSYGTPLTLAEVRELARRSITVDGLKDAILPYALAQPDYAGAWIDHDRGGVLVVQFSGSLLQHQADILRLTRPGAPYEVRQVRWSLAQLEALKDRVSGDEAWFETIPAYLYAVGLDTKLNRLSVTVSSAEPAAADRIKAHFGWTDDIVIINSDGTGALLLQKGSLAIHAVNADGGPVEGLACVAISDIDGANEPRPLPMPTTDEEGVCTIDVAATDYTIHLEKGHAPPTVVAIGRATVKPKRLTEVTIVVP